MAVTQILARVEPETAFAASSSEQALDALISLRFREGEAYCDFDWAPKYIELAVRFSPSAKLLPVVEQAFDGESVLNASFPNGSADYTVYSEVKVNSVGKVQSLAYELGALPISAMSQTKELVQEVIPAREMPNGYQAYICTHAEALRAFYAEAASRKQVVVTWWD